MRTYVVGDKRVEIKLRSANRVVLEEIFKASQEVAQFIGAARQMLVPRRTGWLASNLYEKVEVAAPRGRARFRSVDINIGISALAPYGVYVDHGTGIYHIPNPHSPWMQANLAVPRPGTRQKILLPLQPALHWGQPASNFTARAVEETAPLTRAIYRGAARAIKERLG